MLLLILYLVSQKNSPVLITKGFPRLAPQTRLELDTATSLCSKAYPNPVDFKLLSASRLYNVQFSYFTYTPPSPTMPDEKKAADIYLQDIANL